MTPHTDKGVVAGVDESERSGREGPLIEVVWNYYRSQSIPIPFST